MGRRLIAKINLLPWRQRRREEKRREFTAGVLGMLLLAGVVIFLGGRHLTSKISIQAARNEFLRVEVGRFDAQLAEIDQLRQEKQDIRARMSVIADLQGTRPIIVHVFDELVRTLPDSVYFELVERTDDEIAIEGVADSYSRITELVRRLDASVWFRSTNLSDISSNRTATNPLTESFAFALRLTLESPGQRSSD